MCIEGTLKHISLTLLVRIFGLALIGCIDSEKVSCSDIALYSHKAVIPVKML